ncbi:four helix bundle protein [Tepidimonas taiwanensis]|uniref:four helix bundle protein n=1 Tax=Tepidimonas taiwanensis TaxID=307486 RepID=UPI000734004A|nr:four helix bundle protein [Tepidimonas taiwanensis]
MSHDVTGHEPSAAPTRGAQPALPQAYVELVSRLEDMDVYVHQITAHWPKAERHGLAADVRRQVTLLHRLVAVAWKRKSKSGALFELDVELYVLKTLIRKAYRLGYINANRPAVWIGHADELGQRIGAWIRHESSRGGSV